MLKYVKVVQKYHVLVHLNPEDQIVIKAVTKQGVQTQVPTILVKKLKTMFLKGGEMDGASLTIAKALI